MLEKVKNRAGVSIDIHAYNLRTPTHMEWTSNGHLIVSEHSSGTMKDITNGGDQSKNEPFVYGLKGPSSIAPLKDGRIYVSEMWGNRITDVSMGGDATENLPSFTGLSGPYSLIYMDDTFFVVERESKVSNRVSKVDPDTGDIEHFITGIPAVPMPGAESLLPPEAFPDRWEEYLFALTSCTGWTEPPFINGEKTGVISSSALGIIVRYPEEPSQFMDLAKGESLIATGLDWKGGMKTSPKDGKIYITQPHKGTVVAIDPNTHKDYRFEAPVIQGLTMPSCLRFNEDGSEMYICSMATGIVWKVTGFE